MKKRWLSLFIFCVIGLFCLNTNVSAQISSQVKSGKTTYYVNWESSNKIYQKKSGKSKLIKKLKSNESVECLIAVYKNQLYFTVTTANSDGWTENVKLMKYDSKKKKTTTIKSVKADSSYTLYDNGCIYIYYRYSPNSKSLYVYKCKDKKYSKLLTFKDSKNVSERELLGIYGGNIYAATSKYDEKNGTESVELTRIGIKNKKVSTLKKWDGIFTFQYYKGSIAISHAYEDLHYLGQALSIYDCKGKKYRMVSKNATYPTIIDNKWYCVSQDKKSDQAYIMRCDLSGKNKKKLKTLPKNFCYVEKLTKNKLVYGDLDEKIHTIKY